MGWFLTSIDFDILFELTSTYCKFSHFLIPLYIFQIYGGVFVDQVLQGCIIKFSNPNLNTMLNQQIWHWGAKSFINLKCISAYKFIFWNEIFILYFLLIRVIHNASLFYASLWASLFNYP